MTSYSSTRLAFLLAAFSVVASASPLAAQIKPAAALEFGFEDVKVVSAKGGGEPFEVNKHWSAMKKPAVFITGTLVVRWDLSMFASFAAFTGAPGKKSAILISVGEDDTTPNPVGVISMIWSDLFPEVNDEEGLALGVVTYTVPDRNAATRVKFKIPVANEPMNRNDDDSDFEFVLHIPEGSTEIGGIKLGEDEAKHFLKSVDIKKIEKELKAEDESSTEAETAPDFEDVNR